MAIVHITARLRKGVSPTLLANWWRPRWIGLRRSFPDCLGASLRADHGHLLVESEDPVRELRVFDNAVRNSTRGLGSGIWEIPREPVVVRDRNHLYKTVAYLFRNPLAEPEVVDPLQWLWSTLRDVVGATVDPWSSNRDLARVLGRSREGFARWCLEWIASGDHEARWSSRLPVAAPPAGVPRVGLDDILRAAEVATRHRPEDATRKRMVRWLFVALARHQGWRDVAALASIADVHPRSVYRIGRSITHEQLAAAALCLGDERLLRALPAPRQR